MYAPVASQLSRLLFPLAAACGYLLANSPQSREQNRSSPWPAPLLLSGVVTVLAVLARFWLDLVTEHAPEPYLVRPRRSVS